MSERSIEGVTVFKVSNRLTVRYNDGSTELLNGSEYRQNFAAMGAEDLRQFLIGRQLSGEAVLLTLSQYHKSVMDYVKELEINGYTDYGAVAEGGSRSFYMAKDTPPRFSFSLDWVGYAINKGKSISDIEIKANFLNQLQTMERQLSRSERNNEELLQRFELARRSADMAKLHITLKDMRTAVTSRMEGMLLRGTLHHLLTNSGLTKYGLHNAVAIQLQCPSATRLFTRRELAALHIPIPRVRPLVIYAPTLKSFFQRDDKLIPVLAATNMEQREIAMGAIIPRQDVQYGINFVYDISQLQISQEQRRVLMRDELSFYSLDEFEKFAQMSKSSYGFGITTQEKAMQGLTLESFYDAKSNTIIINPSAPPERLLASYIHSLSDAIVTLTTTSPDAIHRFEAELLAVRLQTLAGFEPSQAAMNEISAAFVKAREFFRDGPDSMRTLELSLARVNRMSCFVDAHIKELVAEKQQLQENIQQITQSYGKTNSARQETPSGSEQLTNFINQIE